jgi:hypothetical protein
MARSDAARGKAFELWTAKLFGGRRRGNNGTGGCDIVDTPLAIECKAPGQLMIRTDWYEQAVRQGEQEGKPWVLAMRPKGWRNPVGIVDLKWLAELVEKAENPLVSVEIRPCINCV